MHTLAAQTSAKNHNKKWGIIDKDRHFMQLPIIQIHANARAAAAALCLDDPISVGDQSCSMACCAWNEYHKHVYDVGQP